MSRVPSIYRVRAVLACVTAVVCPATAAVADGRLPDRPIVFERNEGQFDPRIEFVARSPRWTVLLRRDGITWLPPVSAPNAGTLTLDYVTARVPRAEGVQPLDARAHYFVGPRDKWRTNVHTFSRVALRELYPGVDLEFYFNGRDLEYDIIVRPGGVLSAVRFAVAGADIKRNTDGSLTIAGTSAKVELRVPAAYQIIEGARVQAAARVTTANQRIGFAARRVRDDATLVIDPVLTYATSFGGGGRDIPIAVDVATGGLLIGGSTTSIDLPVTADAIRATHPGGACGISPLFATPCTDGFVASVDRETGQLNFLTYVGGFGHDSVTGVTNLPVEDALVVTGFTTSERSFPYTEPVPSCSEPGTCGYPFIARIDRNVGAGGPQLRYAIRPNGLVGAVGPPQATQFLANRGDTAVVAMSPGITVARVLAAGERDVLGTFAGSGEETARTVLMAADGSVYVAGSTTSGDLPVTLDALQPRSGSSVIRTSADGGLSSVPSDGGLETVQVVASFAFATDGSLIYAGTSRGLARSGDGITWTIVHPSAQTPRVDPADGRVVYARSSGTLIKSTDAGLTWRTLPLPPGGYRDLFVDSVSGALYISRTENNTVLRSDDRGESWRDSGWGTCLEMAGLDGTTGRIFINRFAGNSVACSTPGLFLSTDGGSSFRKVANEAEFLLAADPTSAGTFYISRRAGAEVRIFRSTDAGVTYTLLGSLDGLVPRKLVLDPSAPSTLFVQLDGGRVLRSTDGGATWADAVDLETGSSSGNAFAALAFTPDGSRVFLGVRRTADCFVARFAPTDGLTYLTYLGGAAEDTCSLALATSPRDGDRVLVSGSTYSPDFPIIDAPAAAPLTTPTARGFIVNGLAADGVLWSRVYDDTTSANAVFTFNSYDRFAAHACAGTTCDLRGLDSAGSELWRTPSSPGLFKGDNDTGLFVVGATGGPEDVAVAEWTLPVAFLAFEENQHARINTPFHVNVFAQPATGIEFKFWRFHESSGWLMTRDWSPIPGYDWTPTAADLGLHHFQVWVRTAGSTARYEHYAAHSLTVDIGPRPALTSFELTIPESGGPRVGSAATWTATATGGVAPLEYQFWRLDADGWHIVQTYARQNTYTWTPSAADVGEHALQVWVRNPGSLAAWEDWKALTFVVSPAAPLSVTALTPSSSPTIGTSPTWSAVTSGGRAPLQYKFWRLDADGWHMVQDYSATNTYSWTPGVNDAGSHALQVWVRNQGSTTAFDAWLGTGFFDVPPLPPVDVALSMAPSLPAPTGTLLTWTAAANATGLEYQFWRFDHGIGWQIVQPYGASATYTWTPSAGDSGTHALQVWVRRIGASTAYDGWAGTGFFTISP